MRDLDALTIEVLASALLDPGVAVQHWRRAVEMMPLEDWPTALARPLPRIYLNLRHEPGFTHHAIMRGIYRAAWTSNMVKVNRAAGACAALAEAGVPYRVVKGAAVCAWLDNWGGRRMGDVDLVIPRSSWTSGDAVLRAQGFAPRFPQRSGPSIGAWDGDRGGVLDVHFTEPDGPLAALAFAEAVNPDVAPEAGFAIPDLESCLAISVGHAAQGVAESDWIQGLLDVAALEPLVDRDRALERLRESGMQHEAAAMLRALAGLGWTPARAWPLDEMAILPVAVRRPISVRRSTRPVRHVWRTLRNRGMSPIALLAAQPWLRRYPVYTAWLACGQVRPLEARRIASKGFMPPPPRAVLPGERVTVRFDDAPGTSERVSAWWAGSRDRRFSIRIGPPGRVRLRVLLPAGSVAPSRRMLFLNGRVFGSFPVDDADEATYEVDAPNGVIEGSLREPGRCSPDWLDTIELEIRP